MKKTNIKKDYKNMYLDDYDSEINNNHENNYQINNKKDDSLDQYFNPIEDSHESEDILKKLDNLNFSEETSFEMPQKTFEPLTQNIPKQKDKKINNNNIKEKEKLSKEDLITENKDEHNIYKDDINYNNINNIENDNNDQFLLNNNNENNKKELTEYSLKEKLNRICLSLQGYTLKPKCYENLNNFIQYLPKISKELYQPIDSIFDVFIELLFRMKEEFNVKENLIQKLNNLSVINDGYDKKLLKLKKEIKDKDKEIGSLINKMTFEKDKIKDNSKSKILEINSLKKENQNLNNRLTLYKNKIRKIEADNKTLQNKLRLYFYEKENRINYMTNNNNEKNNTNNNNNVINNINNNNNINKESKNDNKNNNQEEFKINNEKYLLIKRLNMSLVYLLKDINKNICKYDFSLNKIINDEIQGNNYEIDDLDENIETNILIDKNNCKTLCKNFLFNMDVVNNKIIDILKHKDDIFEKKIFNVNDNDDNQFIYS
jgi:hypothetical protein